MDSGALRKWLKFEFGGLHKGIVVKRKSLEKLLGEEEPFCTTKDGRKHVFDKGVLQRIGKSLSAELHSRLKLPMNLFVDMNVENQCYVDDELAAKVIRKLEGFDRAYRFRDGKMWLPMSLSAELMRKHKAAVQMAFMT